MVGGEGWTCLEAKKVLGYEIGGMRVGGGRLEMVGAEKGWRKEGWKWLRGRVGHAWRLKKC